MLAVLRQRNFFLLWSGGVLSVIGDYFLFVALPFFVYERTGSALATGAMFIAETLPRLIFGSVAGVFVDRWDRKKTMVLSDLSRALIVLPLLLVAAGGPLMLVYAVAFVEASVSMFFLPAKGATIPNLVAERDLTAANSLNSLSEEVPSLVGALLGGALLGVVGLSGLILLDVATYLASALLISLISVPTAAAPDEEPEVTPEVAVSAWANALKEWLGGLRLIGRDRSVAILFAVISVATVGEGVVTVLVIIFFRDVLGGGSAEFSYFIAAYGVGGIAGGLLLGWTSTLIDETRLFSLSLIANGLLLVAIFNIPVLAVIVALAVLSGMTVVGWLVTSQTLLQKWVGDRYRGRVFGALETTQALTILLGMGLAVVLAGSLGVVVVLSIVGAAWSLAGVVAWLMLPHGK
ncbi:MAG: MFS transporter [Rubrobacteraceae bacterium]|nr:MFS transporter [Rubrobacteraceae bacterium]